MSPQPLTTSDVPSGKPASFRGKQISFAVGENETLDLKTICHEIERSNELKGSSKKKGFCKCSKTDAMFSLKLQNGNVVFVGRDRVVFVAEDFFHFDQDARLSAFFLKIVSSDRHVKLKLKLKFPGRRTSQFASNKRFALCHICRKMRPAAPLPVCNTVSSCDDVFGRHQSPAAAGQLPHRQTVPVGRVVEQQGDLPWPAVGSSLPAGDNLRGVTKLFPTATLF